MKIYLATGAMLILSLLLAGVMFYRAYRGFVGEQTNPYIGILAGPAAIALVAIGRLVVFRRND